MGLDKKDKLILSLLQEDSTLSVKEISEKIGLTFTPTYERIKNLEKQGVVEKYVAILNREKLGINIVVYCNIRLKEQSQKTLKEFEDYISKYDEVQEIISLSGEYDYMLKVVARDMDDYQQFMKEKLAALENIGRVQSHFVMTEVKNSTILPLNPSVS